MKLGLNYTLRQSLSLTPQLQQAIRLLQLSNLELQLEIEEKLANNPLLEIDSEDGETSTPEEEASAQPSENETNDHMDACELMAQDQLFDNLSVDAQWDDIFDNEGFVHKSHDGDFEFLFDKNAHTTSLRAHLIDQIQTAHFSQIDLLIANYVIDSLDDKGLLMTSDEELFQSIADALAGADIAYDLELDEITSVIKRIQMLDPPGAAARNITECLQLQLHALPAQTPHIAAASQLLTHSALLVKNDIVGLMRATHLDIDTLSAAKDLLKTLSTDISAPFRQQEDSYTPPDVVVTKTRSRWLVQLGEHNLPKLRIQPYYAKLSKQKSQAHQYLNEHLQDAKQFIKSLHERNITLLRVSECIVKQQQAFFEQGHMALKPMILKDIADDLELHESTISRITTNKYILTPHGLFELKYFFSSQVKSDDGDGVSSTVICAMIKKLVQDENPAKPLSDQALARFTQTIRHSSGATYGNKIS